MLVIVAVIVFTLIRLVPGDPAAVIAGNMATNEDIARIRTELGLDRGFLTQFGLWAKGCWRATWASHSSSRRKSPH